MRPAKLHELTLPTQYELWHRYVYKTGICISPTEFTELLNQRQAIELVQTKGWIKCKILDALLINQITEELYSQPYSFSASPLYKAAKRALGAILQRMSGMLGPTL